MGVVLMWILMILILPSLSMAQNLGVHGHLFEIAEPDLLSQIEEKLSEMEQSGEVAQHQKKLLKSAPEKIKIPKPIEGINRASKTRTFTYDPTLTLPYDLKDLKGRVVHKAGTKVNPLHLKPLTKDLVFFDGSDEKQVQWVEDTYLNKKISVKLILVKGPPFELMEKWNQPVFFDQRGFLTQKLFIKAVPAFVRQKNKLLEITEVGDEK